MGANVLKIIILSLLLTSCVTYPRYVKRYECAPDQKDRLDAVTNLCIKSIALQRQIKMTSLMDKCHAVALKSLCTPEDWFQRVSLPFFSVTADIPCSDAITAYEGYVCDER